MTLQRGMPSIVVIGAGLTGSLAALALARRGAAVTLVGPRPERVASSAATTVSYGSLAGWLPALRWRRLQRRHGPLGWHPARLCLHGNGGDVPPAARLAPLLPFSRVDAPTLAARLPGVLTGAGVDLHDALVVDLAPEAGGSWRLQLRPSGDGLPDGEIRAGRVLLAAGAGCRSLWPALPERLRASWAGVLLLHRNPGGSPWLERARRGWVVQPARWRRPELEREVDEHAGERWIVDAGLAPWGDGVVLGQITLVGPGPAGIRPPDPAWMERRLREGLALLDPRLAAAEGAYHQVQVPFCPDGIPLAGPVAGAQDLWIFSGFSGAFAVVPAEADRLAGRLLGGAGDR